MSPIRALEPDDLSAVATLRQQVVLSGAPASPEGLTRHLARTLLDYPGVDPDIPSLVYTDGNGAIVGFQGCCVRRASLDGRPLRVAYACRAMSDPAHRRRGVGAQLLRRFLDGPQDATITDNATEEMRQMWTLMGGRTLSVQSVEWIRILRPWQAAGWWLSHHGEDRRAKAGARLMAGLDHALPTRPRFLGPSSSLTTRSQPLSAPAFKHAIETIDGGWTFRLEYSASFMNWLLAELASVPGLGSPQVNLVTGADGEAVGWYALYLRRRGTSNVLQVAARRGQEGRVLDQLFYDAWVQGAAAVVGRLEPRLRAPLADRQAVLRFAPEVALAHSPDPALLDGLTSEDALLTRMDGEWWMQDRLADLSVASE